MRKEKISKHLEVVSFFNYRDKIFFITADHVSHPDDFDKRLRLGKDDFVWIFNNVNKKGALATMLTSIGGIYYFEYCDIMDELSLEIPDLEDISFSITSNPFKYSFRTAELKIGEQIIVPHGKEKIVINSQCATDLNPNRSLGILLSWSS